MQGQSVSDFQVERSRAVAPLFLRAPHPPQVTPREYQQAGVEYALARNNCLIGDAPGVGKTAQGILISNAIGARRTLVICPASLRLNWAEEVWRWSVVPNVSTYVIAKASNGVSNTAHYVITSYDLLRNPGILAAILALKWDHAILDEAHAIKDPDSKRAQIIMSSLPKAVGRITMLSGTILPNSPKECYNACRLLDWSCIDNMSVHSFTQHYYGEGGGMIRGPVWDEKLQARVSKVHWSENVRNIPQNLDELQHRLRSKIMIRRLKADVLPQLPPKHFHLAPLAITAEMRAALKHPGWARVGQLIDMDPAQFAVAVGVDGAVATARRLLGEAKVGPACDYIDELLHEGIEKIVVSAHHTTVLTVARERLAKYGLVFMDGSTPTGRRQEIVHVFQTDPKVRVILGQTQVLGEGHTLTAAQDVVLLEPDWVPGRIEQMVDRIHRIGQTGAYVQAHLPVVPGQLDEMIIAKAIEKSKSIHLALDNH